jgi:hypothetical protein
MIASASRCLIASTLILFASGARADFISRDAASTDSGRIRLAQAGNSPQVADQAAALPVGRPQAAATLNTTRVPADGDGAALLEVQVPGRFSLRAQSPAGVALQLIDMATGPDDVAGAAGARDGRIDVLLDKGTYKIRTTGAKGSTGEATLSSLAFSEVDGASAVLVRGGQVSNTLADLQQRSYWVAVDKSKRISIEAAGRALQDLRLWSNGTDLVDADASLTTIEPKAGHPLTRARLDTNVEPGLYLVTAYGGAPLVWTDGDSALPFHIRSGPAQDLVGGWHEGIIGPFGSAHFRLPSAFNHVRVELPEPAPLRLMVSGQTSQIQKNSREPVASLDIASSGAAGVQAEVTGFEGQPYRVRALRRATSLRTDRPGPHLVAVDVAGEGGDELPATVMLAEFKRGQTATVLSSSAPRIAPGEAWRKKFNLRGGASILFEIASAGPVAARTEGPGVTVTLEPLLGANAPRADGTVPSTWDVEAGWYVLRIAPVNNAVGILDLTFGQPGLDASASPSAPRTLIQLGVHDFEKDAYYQVFTNAAPRLITGPVVRALPAAIADAPLVLRQPGTSNDPQAMPEPQPIDPSRPLAMPVRVPLGGVITAKGVDGQAIDITTSNEVTGRDSRTLTVALPVTEQARTVILAWAKTEAEEPLPTLAPATAMQPLQAAQPFFFDLKKGERRRFVLDAPAGGLYRVETLGRLKTSLDVATPYLPKLGTASDNGPGHNALLQTYLRAGAYRVNVTASDSSGRLAVSARPAPLPDAGVLVPGGSGRASLSEGSGVVFPIAIAEAGLYRVDLYGLGRTLTARLEDADGWPITKPGPMARLDQQLAPGRYRLVVLPQDVDARVVARLRRVIPDAAPEGHGPHPLAFDMVQKFQWREPQSRDAPRVPDRWEFALAGPSNIVLETSDGMIADLVKVGDAQPLAKIVYKRGFSGQLAAGRYAVEARSLGRNDRLDYELTLRSTEIQSGRARFVDLPATVPFAIASDRVVSLISYGREDLAGTLKDKDGRVIERLSGRADDWNIALSRHLPAGSYQLQLERAGKKARQEANQPSSEGDADAEESDDDKAEKSGVEIQLALPETTAEPQLAFAGSVKVAGPQVHQFMLPRVDIGGLILIAAQSSAELVVSLERPDVAGRWVAAGFARGKAPVIAVPSDIDGQRQWRVTVWAVDGGSAEITVAARALREAAQPLGTVTLAPVTLDRITRPVNVGLVAIPSSGLVMLKERNSGIMEGSRPGRVLVGTDGGVLTSQSERLWLVGRGAPTQTITIEALSASAGEIALTLAENDVAIIPQAAVPAGRTRVWRVQSTFGQPGLSAGRGMGVAQSSGGGSALAPGGGKDLRIWNAVDSEPLRLRAAAIDLDTRPAIVPDAEFSNVLAPRTAQPLSLRPGLKKIEINLVAGAAAILEGGDAKATTVWSGNDTVTRTLEGNWTAITLFNTTDKPAPVSLAVAPTQGGGTLTPDRVMKRFFGAAGSATLRVEGYAGDRVMTAGATATFVADNGAVIRGNTFELPDAGELTLDHEAGLVVAWIERRGKSAWPAVAAKPLAAPQSVKLDGQAMRFVLKQDRPVLLHARTTAPVVLSLTQAGGATGVMLFPAGAELHRYVGAGTAELRLYSPHEGPLAGSLELTATPIVPIAEGLGEARAVAPGATALFGFEVTRAGPVGVGIRSEPDRAMVRLLDATGKPLGEGVTQLHRLDPGRYFVEARIPTTGRTTTIRPAVIGIKPPPSGPPPEVTLQYLEMVGLKPPHSP